MKTKSYIISIATLVLAMLACNLGSAAPTDAPSDDSNSAETEATPAPVIVAPSVGACDNPYMPIVLGGTWSYSIDGPVPDTYVHTILAVEADGFTEQDIFESG